MIYMWGNALECLENNKIVCKNRRFSKPPKYEQRGYMNRVKEIVDNSPNNDFYNDFASLMERVEYSLKNNGSELFVSCVDILGQKLEECPKRLLRQEEQIYKKLENVVQQLQFLRKDYLINYNFGRIRQHGVNHFNSYFNSIGKALID